MRCTHLVLGVTVAVGIAFGAGCGGGSDGSLLGSGANSGVGASPVMPAPSASSTAPTPPGSTPPTATGAKGYFESTVYPALMVSPDGGMTAACGSCHATGNLGAPAYLAGSGADGAYQTITTAPYLSWVTVPANSMLVLHGLHTGPALTNAQLTIITDWLGQEVQERNINPTPTVTVEGELQKVGQCMQLTDFTSQVTTGGNAAAASDLGSDNTTAHYQGNDSPCNTCHSAGDGGFVANSDPQTMLSATQADITFIKKYVTGTVDENGSFSGLAPSHAIEQQVELTQTCAVQGGCHPQISMAPAVIGAIDYFVQQTLTRYNNKQCP